MKERKIPFRKVRISEEILGAFEQHKKRDHIPGPFNTYVEAEISRMVREKPLAALVSQEIAEVKGLLLELTKALPVQVKAFREPEERQNAKRKVA